MIELTGVTKKFGNTTVVDDISFTVEKGEIVGFLGPNGAGKTTTMRMITGYMPPFAGKIKVAGIDIEKNPVKAKEKIGYMPENAPLYKEMTVESYLSFTAEMKGVKKERRAARVKKAMEETGLAGVRAKIIAKLSKGYRQRVGLAQAIINDPEVLVLDEPTAGLDPKQIREIRDLIKNMKGERTIILSTHILPEVSMTCDKVIVINNGTVVAKDEVANLGKSFQKSGGITVEAEAPAQKFIDEISKIKGVVSVSEEKQTGDKTHLFDINIEEGSSAVKDIVAKIVKNEWDLIELKKKQYTLEDVFLKLVTKEEA